MDNLAPVWLASTQKKLSRKEVLSVDIDSAAQDVLKPKGDTSLRRDGVLIYGLANILNRRAQFLLQDTNDTNRNLVAAFSATSISGSSRRMAPVMASQSTQLVDESDFDISAILGEASERIMRSAGVPLSDESEALGDLNPIYDRSIDAVTRSGGPALSDELSDQLTDRDQQSLRGLLSGLDIPETEEPEIAADEPGDLTVNIYSSSPPPEVSTPPQDEDDIPVDVVLPELDPIDDELNEVFQPRKPRQSKRRLAPYDEHTSIRVAKVAPSSILGRHGRTEPRPTEQAPIRDPLDPETSKLLDPEYIRTELKRRRLVGLDPEDEDQITLPTIEIADSGDQEDNAEFESVPALLDALDEDVNGDDSDDGRMDDVLADLSSDPAEIVEAHFAAAREKITAAVASGPTRLSALVDTPSTKAATFFELLSMSTSGAVKCTQRKAYGDIQISRVL